MPDPETRDVPISHFSDLTRLSLILLGIATLVLSWELALLPFLRL